MGADWLSRQIATIRGEWEGSAKLRWGGGVIAAILFVYLVLVLVDWRRDLLSEYQQRTSEIYKMMALSRQDQWLVRAGEAKALRQALVAEIPAAKTLGLAQADAQSTLRQVLTAFGRDLTTNAVEPSAVDGQPGVWRVPITINGIVQPRLLLEIFRRIEGNQRLVTIDQASLVIQGGRSNLSMTVVAYYRIPMQKRATNAAP